VRIEDVVDRVVIGAPGTGKTYLATHIFHKKRKKGEDVYIMNPYRELRKEIARRISGLSGDSFDEIMKKNRTPFGFSYVLSIQNGIIDPSEVVMDYRDYDEFFSQFNMKYTPKLVFDMRFGGNVVLTVRDAVCNYYSKPITKIDYKREFRPLFDTTYYDVIKRYDPLQIYEIAKRLEEYKQDNNMIEYIDMLLRLDEFRRLVGYNPFEGSTFIIDEFQNITPLLLNVIEVLNPKELIILGDPNQQVNRFFGGDQEFLHNIMNRILKNIQPQVLRENYRIPRAVFRYLETNICTKFVKSFNYGRMIFRKKGGEVRIPRTPMSLDSALKYIENYIRKVYGKGTILIQAESHYIVDKVENYLLKMGIPCGNKRIGNDVRMFYNVLVLAKKSPGFIPEEYTNIIMKVVKPGYDRIVTTMLRRGVEPMKILELTDLKDYEKDWIKNMLIYHGEPIKKEELHKYIVDVMTTIMSPGLTRDYNFVLVKHVSKIEKLSTRFSFLWGWKIKDSYYKVLYTAIARTNTKCWVIPLKS